MKKIIPYLLFFALITSGTLASAANLDGHMQYKIVSYSLTSKDATDAAGSIHFGPLLITDSTSDILTNNLDDTSVFGFTDPKLATEIFALSADIDATPDLSLYGAIGITKNRWESSLHEDYESGWEANLGVIYRLFNNINYEIHFGYMDTGDLFKQSDTYSDVESIIMISNKLTMSF